MGPETICKICGGPLSSRWEDENQICLPCVPEKLKLADSLGLTLNEVQRLWDEDKKELGKVETQAWYLQRCFDAEQKGIKAGEAGLNEDQNPYDPTDDFRPFWEFGRLHSESVRQVAAAGAFLTYVGGVLAHCIEVARGKGDEELVIKLSDLLVKVSERA